MGEDVKLCQKCDHGLVEPFYSGDPSSTLADALYSLAEQERKYPNPADQAQYEVEVCRSATKHATLMIDNATGPANAHFAALDAASNHEFGSDSSIQYDVNYCVGLNNTK